MFIRRPLLRHSTADRRRRDFFRPRGEQLEARLPLHAESGSRNLDHTSVALFFNFEDSSTVADISNYANSNATTIDKWLNPPGMPVTTSQFVHNYWSDVSYGHFNVYVDALLEPTTISLPIPEGQTQSDGQDWVSIAKKVIAPNLETIWRLGGAHHDEHDRRLIPSVVLVQNYDTRATAYFEWYELMEDDDSEYIVKDIHHISISKGWGTLIHEYAHNFLEGLDQYYEYGTGTGGRTGNWDILGSDEAPGAMPDTSSFFKTQWTTFKHVISGPVSGQQEIRLKPYYTFDHFTPGNSSMEAIKIVPDPVNEPNEYFLVEYRAPRPDADIWTPDGHRQESGLLVTHIRGNAANLGRGVGGIAPFLDFEEADGNDGKSWEEYGEKARSASDLPQQVGTTGRIGDTQYADGNYLGPNRGAGVLFPLDGSREFTPESNPSSDFYGGRASGLEITNIRLEGGEAVFSVRLGGNNASVYSLTDQDRFHAVDIDGDGKDEVMISNGSELVMVHESQNQFHVMWRTPGRGRPVVGDFNGDGRDDVVLSADNELRLLLGNGRYPEEVWMATGNVGSWPLALGDQLATGDFDGDGRDDLLLSNDRSLAWLLSTERGFYEAWSAQGQIESWQITDNSFLVGDFNADGRDDVFAYASHGFDPGIALLGSRPDGLRLTWSSTTSVGDWTLKLSDRYLVGDFTGDGRADIFARSDSLRSSLALFQYVPGELRNVWQGDSSRDSLDWLPSKSDQFVVADFTGDGIEDLHVHRGTDAAIWAGSSDLGRLFERAWRGRFGGFTFVPNGDERVVAGKYNFDSSADLFIYRPGQLTATALTLLPYQAGDWESPTDDLAFQIMVEPGWIRGATTDGSQHNLLTKELPPLPDRQIIGNFSGDSRSDVLVWNTRELALFKNVNGHLQRIWQSGPAVDNWRLSPFDEWHVGDFTGDGLDDLFAFSPNWGAALFRATGSGFRLAWSALDWIDGWHLGNVDQYVVGDFTGDGRDDIFIHNSGWAGLLQSTGTGFSNSWIMSTAVGGLTLSAQSRALAGNFVDDEQQELLLRTPQGAAILKWDGNQLATTALAISSIDGFPLSALDEHLALDTNGTGVDRVVIRNRTRSILVDGSLARIGPQSDSVFADWNLAPYDQLTVADFDHDRKQELLIRRPQIGLNAAIFAHSRWNSTTGFSTVIVAGGGTAPRDGFYGSWPLNSFDKVLVGQFYSPGRDELLFSHPGGWTGIFRAEYPIIDNFYTARTQAHYRELTATSDLNHSGAVRGGGVVLGSGNNDSITIEYIDDYSAQVTIYSPGAWDPPSYTISTIDGVRIESGAGSDTIHVDTRIVAHITIDAQDASLSDVDAVVIHGHGAPIASAVCGDEQPAIVRVGFTTIQLQSIDEVTVSDMLSFTCRFVDGDKDISYFGGLHRAFADTTLRFEGVPWVVLDAAELDGGAADNNSFRIYEDRYNNFDPSENPPSLIQVLTGPGADSVRVEGLRTTNLVIDTGAIDGEAEQITLSEREYWDSQPSIRGNVQLVGTNRADLSVVEHDSMATRHYTIEADSVTITGVTTTGGRVDWSDGPRVRSVSIAADGKSSIVRVEGNAPGTHVDLHSLPSSSNPFGDQFIIGGGDYLSNIRGSVHLQGGQNTKLVVDDSTASWIAESYVVDDEQFSKIGHTVFLWSSELVRVEGPELTWEDVSAVTLLGSRVSSSFFIPTVGTGVHVTLEGGQGDDTFSIGRGNLFEEFESNIRIDGGEGNDRINLHDEDATTPGGYVFGTETASDGVLEAHFQKWFASLVGPFPIVFRSGELNARGVEHLELQGSALGDVFDVGGTLPALTYNLFGGEGVDEFRVQRSSQRSPVTVYGGGPVNSPGDSLLVLGTGTEQAWYKPYEASVHSGVVEIDGPPITFYELEPVTLDGFARVTFESPLSLDFAALRRDGDGLEISGTSYNPIPLPGSNGQISPPPAPTPWEKLRVKNTREVAIDLATNDARSFSAGPYSYAPIPNDHVTIHPGALQTPGLTRVLISTGAGINVVEDHTLESAGPATASLVTNGGFFTASGDTYHLLHGSADRFEVDHPFAAATETKALAADGTVLAEFIDLRLGGGIVFLDPQRDVQVDARHFAVTLSEGGQGRQRFEGPQINPLEISASSVGRLELLGTGTVDLEDVVFPFFDFGPLLGTGLVLSGPVEICVVTNTNDSGPGSLREALECSYAASGDALAVVTFAIPETDANFVDIDSHLPGGDPQGDVFVISPLTILPTNFRGRVVINGQSQHNFTGDSNPFGPEIVLAGNLAGTTANGLTIGSLDNRIHGLNIQGFGGNGVYLSGSGNVVTGSYIGTDPTGTFASQSSAGLVSQWAAEGNTEDSVGNHDGILVNGASFAPGRSGQAFRFDGVDDYVATPLVVDYSSGVTFELWVSTLGDGGNALMAGGGGATADRGMGLFLEGGRPGLGGTKGTPGSPNFVIHPNISITDGQFHHIVATWTGDTSPNGVKLYLDGQLVGTATAATSISSDGTPLYLGDHPSYYLPFRGVIDEPAVYGRVLSEAEVASQFRTGSRATANGASGVRITNGDGNRIGGALPGDRNVISSNEHVGVLIEGNSIDWPGPGDPPIYTDNPDQFPYVGNTVSGNVIGLAADGVTPLGNGDAGVFVADSALNRIEGNTVSGNHGNGVTIQRGNFNRITNNHIGTTADGMAQAGNTGQGILVSESSQLNQMIGNVVSGNHQNGILVDGSSTRTQAEDFGSLLNTFLNGWSGLRFQENRDSFGYVNSNLTQGTPGGEAGGSFARASSALGESVDYASYYADTDVGRFTLNDALQASGELIFTALDRFNGSVEIGYINTDSAQANQFRNLLSMRVAEPSPNQGTTGIRVFAEIVLANGTRVVGTAVNAGPGLQLNVPYTWELNYDPASGANNKGRLEVKIFAEGNLVGTSFVSLTAAHRNVGATFNAFGMHNGSQPVHSNNPNTITLFVDNLRYTHEAAGNTFQGNFIGTDALGNSALSNGASGVVLANAAPTQVGGIEPGQGNVISGNLGNGVHIDNGYGHVMAGNFIGTTADGMSALGNGSSGILIDNSSYNVIGGSTPEERNILGGNFTGISISGTESVANQISGNYIGVGRDGRIRLPNLNGVALTGFPGAGGGVRDNVIGGTTEGQRNVISGNAHSNVLLGGTVHTIVQGNYIGPDVDGQSTPGQVRSLYGVYIVGNDRDSVIGGTQPGSANVISGHSYGVRVDGWFVPQALSGTRITGNLIGTTSNGLQPLANEFGVYLLAHVDSNGKPLYVDNVVIGGTEPEARNLISGNATHGVLIVGPGITNSRVQGNWIGIDATGNLPLPNRSAGVRIENASGVLVGGTDAGARNVISGNQTGVSIFGAQSHDNRVAGNFIGLAADGLTALGNTAHGVLVSGLGNTLGGAGNLIGGTDASLRNVISANGQNNISLASSGTMVQGNFIGSDATGTRLPQGLGQGRVGVRVNDDVNSIIGGDEPGAGNVIVGHSWGIYLSGRHLAGGAQGTRIQGNSIGILADGETVLANIWGIDVDGFVDSDGLTRRITDVLIGGTEPGAGNVISGNANQGIRVHGPGAAGVVIQGNWIGTGRDGTEALPNGPATTINGAGILLDSASGVQIGGMEEGARNVISSNNGNGISLSGTATGNEILDNVISANGRSGVLIEGTAASGTLIAGNVIGTDALGTLDRGNAIMGVWIINSPGNTVRDNLISGNNVNGLVIAGANARGNVAEHNFIGTDATGTYAIGNFLGIHLADAPDNQILSNLVSGNVVGLDISGAGAGGNLVSENHIGTRIGGTGPLPNTADGVFIDNAPGNTLERNTIAANGFNGVLIAGEGSTSNVLLGNTIGAVAVSPAPIATFNFESSLDDAQSGRSLVPVGPGRFVTDTVFGTQRTVYEFDAASGLTLDTNGLLGLETYTIEAVFRFDDVVSWQKIIDFENRTEDTGLYVYDGALQFYPENPGGVYWPGRYHRIVLTRAANGEVVGYIDGGEAFRFEDATDDLAIADIDNPENLLHFFLDDVATLYEETSAGRIAQLQVYNTALSATQVVGLGNLGNRGDGILISDGASHNTIGGNGELARNIISGNHDRGIHIVGSEQNTIQGNFIGTNSDGSAGLPNTADGVFMEDAPHNTLANNTISANGLNGVLIEGTGSFGNVLTGNRIGTDVNGEYALGNSQNGVRLAAGASNHQLVDNLISANGWSGIAIEGLSTTATSVLGNRIGTDASGQVDLGNRVMGVWVVGSSGNQIGGLQPGEGNLISGNDVNGVVIAGASASANLVVDNLIGTDATGTYAIGNVLGIHLADAPGNTVTGNLLSGNVVGLDISGATATGNVVRDNTIGMSLDRSTPLGNTADGVFIDDAPGNTLLGNTISGNGYRGVYIEGVGSTANVLQGNRIGAGAQDYESHPNGLGGVVIDNGASFNVIGTNGDGLNDAAEGNLTAYNAVAGVQVVGDSSRGNSIRANAIFANSGLGIDLGVLGVTPNDRGELTLGVPPDTDQGPNTLQNFPEISSVQPGVETRISGVLRSTPGDSFVIDFYASASADPSGYGEGQRWLGSVTVLANEEGVARFNVTLPAATFGGEWITATATRLVDVDGDPATPAAIADTSEFSTALEIKSGKIERGPKTFRLEFPADSSGEDPLPFASFEVQVLALVDPEDDNRWINVEEFAASVANSTEGPIGMPLALAAYSTSVSPQILAAVSSGLTLDNVKLVGETSVDGVPYEFARWSMDNVQITSYASRNLREDWLTLSYDRLEYEYTPLTPRGAPGMPISGVWDVASTSGHVLDGTAEFLHLPNLDANVKYYLDIPGIPGDSQREGFQNQIEVASVDLAVQNVNRNRGEALHVSTLSVVSRSGRAAPGIFAAATGQMAIDLPVTLVAVHDGLEAPGTIAEWTLTGARIVSFATASGDWDGFEIAFDALEYWYADVDPTTGKLGAANTASLDLANLGATHYLHGFDLSGQPDLLDGNRILAKVPGVTGDSLLAGYDGWIPVDTFQFRVDHTSIDNASPALAASSFAFVGATGKGTSQLFGLATSGSVLEKPVEIAIVNTSATKAAERARWTLGGAQLGGFATRSATLDAFTVGYESLSLQVFPEGDLSQPPGLKEIDWNLSAADAERYDSGPALPDSHAPRSGVSLLVKLPGIDGGATLKGYAGWMTMDAFSFLLSNPLTDPESPTSATTFQFEAESSPASPELLRALLTGQTFASAYLAAVTTRSGKVQELVRWELSNVQVVSFATENTLHDSFTLSFDAVRYKFVDYSPKTGLPQEVNASWNLSVEGGQVFDVGPRLSVHAPMPDVRAYVQVADIVGVSQLQGYQGWIEVDSYQLQATRQLGAPQVPPTLTTFAVTSSELGASPHLMESLLTGRAYSGPDAWKLATVRVPRNGPLQELALWTLDDAQVDSLISDSLLNSALSVTYDTLDLRYQTYSDKGVLSQTSTLSWKPHETPRPIDAWRLLDPTVPLPADVALLLKVPQINGSSLRVDYVDWIEIDRATLDLNAPSSDPTQQSMARLALTLTSSQASPRLFSATVDGRVIPEIELVALINGQDEPLVHVRLRDVTFRGFHTDGSARDTLQLDAGYIELVDNENREQSPALLAAAVDVSSEIDVNVVDGMGVQSLLFTAPSTSEQTVRSEASVAIWGNAEDLFPAQHIKSSADLSTAGAGKPIPSDANSSHADTIYDGWFRGVERQHADVVESAADERNPHSLGRRQSTDRVFLHYLELAHDALHETSMAEDTIAESMDIDGGVAVDRILEECEDFRLDAWLGRGLHQKLQTRVRA
jgi:parallel beta-helix repeat protein